MQFVIMCYNFIISWQKFKTIFTWTLLFYENHNDKIKWWMDQLGNSNIYKCKSWQLTDIIERLLHNWLRVFDVNGTIKGAINTRLSDVSPDYNGPCWAARKEVEMPSATRPKKGRGSEVINTCGSRGLHSSVELSCAPGQTWIVCVSTRVTMGSGSCCTFSELTPPNLRHRPQTLWPLWLHTTNSCWSWVTAGWIPSRKHLQ